MDSILQLKTLFFSFLFGMFFFYVTKYNYYITQNMKVISKYLITFIFVIDGALLYLYLLFKLNHGKVHIYYLLMFSLGYFLMLIINRKLSNKLSKIRKIDFKMSKVNCRRK